MKVVNVVVKSSTVISPVPQFTLKTYNSGRQEVHQISHIQKTELNLGSPTFMT